MVVEILMRIVRSLGWFYLVGNLWLHKAFEIGVQKVRYGADKHGFSLLFRFTTRGDHAGLVFNVALFGVMFEASLYDTRHWNWLEDRWMRPTETLRFLSPAQADDEAP